MSPLYLMDEIYSNPRACASEDSSTFQLGDPKDYLKCEITTLIKEFSLQAALVF